MYFDLKKVKYLKTCLHIAQHTAECSNCRYERIYAEQTVPLIVYKVVISGECLYVRS